MARLHLRTRSPLKRLALFGIGITAACGSGIALAEFADAGAFAYYKQHPVRPVDVAEVPVEPATYALRAEVQPDSYLTGTSVALPGPAGAVTDYPEQRFIRFEETSASADDPPLGLSDAPDPRVIAVEHGSWTQPRSAPPGEQASATPPESDVEPAYVAASGDTSSAERSSPDAVSLQQQ